MTHPYKREAEGYFMATRGEEHVTMETDIGVMWPQVKACQ